MVVKLPWAQQESRSLQRDWEDSDAIAGRRLFPGPKLDLTSPSIPNPLIWKFSCESPTSQMKSGFHPRASAGSLPQAAGACPPPSRLRGEKTEARLSWNILMPREPGHQVGHCPTPGMPLASSHCGLLE